MAVSPLAALLLLTAALALLLFSAKYFIDAIANLASAAGISPLIIGMTVVAFGTSTPELTVNALSAARGETALAFGNIAGSCTVNIGFVLALTALYRPLKVEPSLVTREIPMLLAAVTTLLILASDGILQPQDGLVLLVLFAIFLYYTTIYSLAQQALLKSPADPFLQHASELQAQRLSPRSLAIQLAITAVSLTGVSLGASFAVDAASSLARALGLAENIIGLTIVSLGTTLPELVTCLLAARRGNPDIALGNIVGSNIFNILAIGGIVPAIHSVSVPAGGFSDLALMALLSAILLPIAIRKDLTITRAEGAFLGAVYTAYTAWRLLTI